MINSKIIRNFVAMKKILLHTAFLLLLLLMAACNGKEKTAEQSADKAVADSLADLMYDNFDACDFAKVVEIGNDVLHRYETLGDTMSMSDVMGTMCIAYQRLGNVTEGLEMSQRAVALDSIIGDYGLLSGDYNTIAGLYLSEDRAAEAEPFIIKAISCEQKTPKQERLSNRYGIASEIYCKLKQPERALDYATKGLALAEERKDSAQMGTRLSQLGDAYMAMGKMEEARTTFMRCTELLRAGQSYVSLAIVYRQLGNIYEDRHQIAEAIDYYEKAADLARKTQYSMLLCQCTQAIGELSAGANPNYPVRMLMESRALADTLHSKKVADMMAGYAAKFDLNEKRMTIERQTAELKMHRMITTVIVVLILAAIIVSALVFYMKRLRRKHEQLEVRLSEKVVRESQHQEEEVSAADKEFMDHLATFVEAHMADSQLSSTVIAEEFCLSPRQFSRRVKQLTGIDTTHYIRASRILKARHLLATTDLTMQEICMKCGFDTQNYFSRIFRNDVGMTPTEYRKTAKK